MRKKVYFAIASIGPIEVFSDRVSYPISFAELETEEGGSKLEDDKVHTKKPSKAKDKVPSRKSTKSRPK